MSPNPHMLFMHKLKFSDKKTLKKFLQVNTRWIFWTKASTLLVCNLFFIFFFITVWNIFKKANQEDFLYSFLSFLLNWQLYKIRNYFLFFSKDNVFLKYHFMPYLSVIWNLQLRIYPNIRGLPNNKNTNKTQSRLLKESCGDLFFSENPL